jgi:hypothetical protein
MVPVLRTGVKPGYGWEVINRLSSDRVLAMSLSLDSFISTCLMRFATDADVKQAVTTQLNKSPRFLRRQSKRLFCDNGTNA